MLRVLGVRKDLFHELHAFPVERALLAKKIVPLVFIDVLDGCFMLNRKRRCRGR